MTTLPTRRLGADGPEVSAIGLGFMSFRTSAGPADEKQATDLVGAAIDLGVTLFDTADVYGPEFSEQLLGRAVRGRRDSLVIATKFGNALDRDINPDAQALDGRPEYVRSAIDGSLRRLGIDHVDLYYRHRVDPQVTHRGDGRGAGRTGHRRQDPAHRPVRTRPADPASRACRAPDRRGAERMVHLHKGYRERHRPGRP